MKAGAPCSGETYDLLDELSAVHRGEIQRLQPLFAQIG
jgi:hypothetical protein